MKGLLTIVAAAAVTLGAHAEQQIDWLETVHDYGAIDENDGPATCLMKFVNRGSTAVSIVDAHASCGCTTPRYSRVPIMPGDTGVVVVTYDPAGRPGRFTKKVRVDTSDGEGETVHSSLMIKGAVIGSSNTLRSRYPVDAGPAKLRNESVIFGEIKKNAVKTMYVEAYNASADTIRPWFDELPDYIDVRAIGPCVAPAEQLTFAVVLDSRKLPLYGLVTDSITFHGGEGVAPVKLDLVAIVKEDFSRLTPKARANAPVVHVEPATVDFATIRGNEPLTATFDIINRGNDPLLVRRLYTGDPGIAILSAPEKIKKGKRATVTVEVDPTKLPSEMLNARVQLITNDPDNPVQTIRLVGLKQQ